MTTILQKQSNAGPFPDSAAAVRSICAKMEEWGVSHTFLARRLGVSRQYVWQVLNQPEALSLEAALIESTVDTIIARQMHLQTLGDGPCGPGAADSNSQTGRLGDRVLVGRHSEVGEKRLPSRTGGAPEALRSLRHIVRDRQANGNAPRGLRRWQNAAYLVPVQEGEGLPWARPSQRRPLQRMVIRISEGDVATIRERSPARGPVSTRGAGNPSRTTGAGFLNRNHPAQRASS